jgi:phosphatidylglycerophosphate synthase
VRRLAQRRTSNLYDTWFTRNVSVWITTGLARFETSPNAVTAANFVVGIGGCALIGFGGTSALVIAGIVLVHLYAVLDSVDGELARLLDRRSLRGMFLEDWSAYALISAFPLAVSLYLVASGASWWAVILAGLFAAVGRNAMPALRRAIAQSDAMPLRAAGDRAVDGRVSGWKGYVEHHVLHHTNIRLVLTTLIVLHLLTAVRFPLEVAFYGYVGALFLREAWILIRAVRGDLIERELQHLRGRSGGSPPGPPRGGP